MKTGVLTLLDTLHLQGAENVAVNIAINLKNSEHYSPFVCITRKGGVLEEKLQEHNIQYIILERNHFYEIHKFTPVSKLIKDNNIKLIHAHKIGSNLWASLISVYYKIPTISHYHGHNYNKNRKPSSIISNMVIARLSTAFITASDSIRQSLITRLEIPEAKITTIHNAIDSSIYRIEPNLKLKESLSIKPHTPVVSIVAALTEVKNHELFLKAARDVLNNQDKVRFLIIGQGPRRKYLEELATTLKIRDYCIFTGFRQDIPELLSFTDVGVISSHSEGLPLSVIEYMASSKPAITTNVGGISELVRDNISGFLVPPGNHLMLAEKVRLLIENKKMADQMGQKGRSIIEEEFSEETMMNKIIDLYGKVLSTKNNKF